MRLIPHNPPPQTQWNSDALEQDQAPKQED